MYYIFVTVNKSREKTKTNCVLVRLSVLFQLLYTVCGTKTHSFPMEDENLNVLVLRLGLFHVFCDITLCTCHLYDTETWNMINNAAVLFAYY